MRRFGLMMLTVAALSGALSAAAAAQETTGTITGIATDQTGGALPGVAVTVKNTDTGIARTIVTNEAGFYTASLLPIGQYEVTFELQGFQSVTLRNVVLHVNDRLQLDARLAVGGVAESVDVAAGRTLVQPIAALQSTMTSTQVKELPLNNRNFVQLATLAPGVSSDLSDEVGVGLTSTVSISINGARRNAVNWLVDGVSDVDVGSNITLLSTPSLESIEEFKIITNGYQAEWPRSGGGIVNVVTKSGSSRYSGSGYEFLRSDKLNANAFFRNLNPDPAINSQPAPLKYNNFGGTVGGPVVPSKMFFFFSEELRRITRAPTTLTANTFDPAWLTDPTNANYVPPALRDPNALKLLSLFPAPNVTGRLQFLSTQPTIQNTRQEVARVDYDLNANYRFTDSFTWQRGAHGFKFGGLTTFERKNENAANVTQGSFSIGQGGGHTAFYNFLSGNGDASCGNACTYTEAQRDVTEHLRFNRYEMFAQDSWKPRPNVTVDYGVRYALYPPVTDTNNTLTNFLPSRFDPAKAPTCANAACTTIVTGTGDPLNGIIVAGQNSPFGNAVYAFDKTNVQPRVGVTWDPRSTGRTIYRGSYGVYYDQALVGIFEQNSFTNPPIVNTVSLLNARLSNPAAGTTSTTSGVLARIGNGDDFKTPRTQQWNIGLQRQLYARGALDVGYVGGHGDHLIRQIDVDYPQPADVLRLGSVNLARPYLGYGAITLRTTNARSNYWGVLASFRHDGGAAGALSVNYTLSRTQTDASNDRDAIDIPQNPLDLEAEYADARTDRRHIFTANYVYNIPFLKDSPNVVLKAVLGGWQVAGITAINSGQPIPRISESTNGFLRGGRPNIVADPAAGSQTGNLFWFNPNAYTPAADGTFGNSRRAEFRQPGRNQTDLSISKNWTFNRTQRIQFRADAINAFNHTQWLADPQAAGLDNTCTVSLTTCNTPADTFGQILAARAPREIQLGLKFYW